LKRLVVPTGLHTCLCQQRPGAINQNFETSKLELVWSDFHIKLPPQLYCDITSKGRRHYHLVILSWSCCNVKCVDSLLNGACMFDGSSALSPSCVRRQRITDRRRSVRSDSLRPTTRTDSILCTYLSDRHSRIPNVGAE